MWSRFTEAAKRAIYDAQQTACGGGQHLITPDHLMTALIGGSQSIAFKISERCGAPPEKILAHVSQMPSVAEPPTKTMRLTRESKASIDRAYDAARRLNHEWIGPEHLLAGILQHAEKRKDFRFRDAGLTHARVMEDISHRRGAWPPPPSPSTIAGHSAPPASGNAAAGIALILSVGAAAIHLFHTQKSPAPYPLLHITCLIAIWCGWQARKSKMSQIALLAIFTAAIHEAILCAIALMSH
ncbi:hypothetical protein CCAX7_26860 [Capsulimonas corticalis]|uniref:Uncharacterized protein n=1 Tax=Capsulimonas corticalis TaxID=2219043 RepID=A0A402CTT0_9BACT|nr:Clp protease N-terminal domain-containing protein [Capsulimonas corticalis]BDI30635.1 hypothetical protein CCAX7_26860 [Capsulimonas corticalis]